MQGFEVVLLNASFGCIGELFFNLAWQAYELGFACAYRWVRDEAFEAGDFISFAAPAHGFQPKTRCLT